MRLGRLHVWQQFAPFGSEQNKSPDNARSAGLLRVVAETEGFEPSMRLYTPYSLSRGAPSATRSRFQETRLSHELGALIEP
jgi:hypothetical protein